MRNEYVGKCFVCNKKVAVGEGWFQSIYTLPKEMRLGNKKWLIRCLSCKFAGNKPLNKAVE